MSREPSPGSSAMGRSGYEPTGERRTMRRWSNWRPASSAIGPYEVILLRALRLREDSHMPSALTLASTCSTSLRFRHDVRVCLFDAVDRMDLRDDDIGESPFILYVDEDKNIRTAETGVSLL